MERKSTISRYDPKEVDEKLNFLDKHQEYILKMLKDVSFRENNESLFAEMNKELAEDGQIIFSTSITEFGDELKLLNIKVTNIKTENPCICVRILDDPELDEEFNFKDALEDSIDDYFRR